MPLRSLRHRAPLLWLVLPLMAGTVWGRCIGAPAPAVALALAVIGAVAALWLASRPFAGWAGAIALGMFFAGTAGYALHNPPLGAWAELPPREATLVLHLDRLFPRGDAAVSGIGTLVDAAGAARELIGRRIYLSLRRDAEGPAAIRSADLRCTGVLARVPDPAPMGSFDRYLLDAGVRFRFSRGWVDAEVRPPRAYYVFLEHTAQRLNAWLGLGIAAKRPDLTAVFRAMMLGQKHELTPEQDALFMQSGTMHLFAINGVHIGVVALCLHACLALLRCPRPIAAALTLAVLWFDVDTTGASPSAVRAFLLVACAEIGFLVRRRNNGVAAVSAAALIVLLLDPNALFTASFQMSYGVVLAILCFGLPLAEWLQETVAPFRDLPAESWSRRQRVGAAALRKTWPMLGIGLSATLVSGITGPEFFNVFAPIGFLSNFVLVPLAMLVIQAGCVAIAAGALGLPALTVLFNHAALLVLVGIEAIIRRSVGVPSAWWTAHWRVDWAAPVALAALLGTILFGYATGWKARLGGWWPPVIVVAVSMMLGLRFG